MIIDGHDLAGLSVYILLEQNKCVGEIEHFNPSYRDDFLGINKQYRYVVHWKYQDGRIKTEWYSRTKLSYLIEMGLICCF